MLDCLLSQPVIVRLSVRVFYVFFFQAEDGIRDLTVTGVQTCALPIYSVPVAYIGPCGLGAGCRVSVTPQDTTLAGGGSFLMRVAIDSAGAAVAGVPVMLTNLTPDLILVGPDPGIPPPLSPTGGAARAAAAIRGPAHTPRLPVSPPPAPPTVSGDPG